MYDGKYYRPFWRVFLDEINIYIHELWIRRSSSIMKVDFIKSVKRLTRTKRLAFLSKKEFSRRKPSVCTCTIDFLGFYLLDFTLKLHHLSSWMSSCLILKISTCQFSPLHKPILFNKFPSIKICPQLILFLLNTLTNTACDLLLSKEKKLNQSWSDTWFCKITICQFTFVPLW
jgi:hypothetical protein